MRIPKKEYFEQRLQQAIENGNTKKAQYFKSRLSQYEFKIKLEMMNFKNDLMAFKEKDAIKKAKAKMEGLTENEKVIECKRFYEAMEEKGVNLNSAMSFMSKVVGGTISAHAMCN